MSGKNVAKRGQLRRCLGYLKPYWFGETLAILASVGSSALGLVFPWINKVVIDDVVLGKDIYLLQTVCLALLAATLVQAGFRMTESYLFASIGERTVVDLRRDLLTSLLASSVSHHNTLKAGRVLSTVTNDVGGMQGLYTRTLANALTDGFKFLLTFGVLVWIDWRIAVSILPCLTLFGVVVGGFSPALRNLARRAHGETATLSGDLQETLGGIRDVKALRLQEQEMERHGNTLGRLLKLGIRRQLGVASASVGAESVAMLTMTLALFLCSLQVLGDAMQLGVLVAFTHYVSALFSPVARLTALNSQLQGALGSADRVFDLMDTARRHQEPCATERLPEVVGRVRFEAVDFSYEAGKQILHDINLQVDAGQKVAFVGPSGAGKTTLAMLLLGFYDYEGSITIDGIEVRDIHRDTLRSQVGAVLQEPFLFDLTVRENIALGRPDASLEDIREAARNAHADGFIEDLTEGYETRVGERGVTLSGGQKQRLAIARMFLMDPRILILDEATSALDSESEALVLEALGRLLRGRTAFVIAHRMSTVVGADHIVVLDAGRSVEAGSHDKLLSEGNLYPQLYRRQLTGGQELTGDAEVSPSTSVAVP